MKVHCSGAVLQVEVAYQESTSVKSRESTVGTLDLWHGPYSSTPV